MKKKARSLTPDEQRLWQKVTKDVAHYRQTTDSFEALLGDEKTMNAPVPVSQRATSQSPPPKRAITHTPSKASEPHQPRRVIQGSKSIDPQSVFAGGDPKIERQARRGRIEIDAVLDLHGSTQIIAQERLTQFIALARHQNAKCVLIITGKGIKRHFDTEHSKVRGASKFSMDQERTQRGILRERFLQWVENEPLRSQIIRVAGAKPADGGTGAFYVFLRKRADQR